MVTTETKQINMECIMASSFSGRAMLLRSPHNTLPALLYNDQHMTSLATDFRSTLLLRSFDFFVGSPSMSYATTYSVIR